MPASRFSVRIARQPALAGLALLACLSSLPAKPILSEFMAQNNSTLADEDGAFSDWIEIHNPSSSPISLTGWHLTDDITDPTQWTFPETSIAPGGYLLVFASGKDRRIPGQNLHTNFALAAGGEALALLEPDGETVASAFLPSYPPQQADVSFGIPTASSWQRLAGKSSPVRVLVPNETTGPALGTSWRQRSFNDSSWTQGTLAVGYRRGTSDPLGMRQLIETNVEAQTYNIPDRLSIYLRIPFMIDEPSSILNLELRTQYDDGYAAFLNGSTLPVDSANAPATLSWTSGATATEFDSNGLSMRTTPLTAHLGSLVAGQNLLAVQGLNVNRTSSDLLIAPQIWARIAQPIDPANPPAPGFFLQPTPAAANGGMEDMVIFEEITFSEPSRTFFNSLNVTLGGAPAGAVIRYTTNGTVPTTSSPIAPTPLVLNATTRLRARIFNGDGIGSPTYGRHYTRLESSLATRRSNLPMIVLDAAGQSLNSTTRSPAHFLLFDRDSSGLSSLTAPPTLATRQGLRWRGSSSEGQPKKPYSVEFWDELNEEVRHPVLGMTSESDWVLYAPYNFDRAYIRNSVAYEMSRRIGRWAPQTRMVEVFFNSNGGDLLESDYAGVYAIIEQVKLNTRRIGFRTVEPTDVPPPGPIDLAATGPWTGGYLFKIDRTDPDEYDWLTQRNIPTSLASRLTLNRPKMPNLDGGPYFSNAAAEAGSRQVAYLRSAIQAFEDALYLDQSANFTTRRYLDHIDRDAWVDHLILSSFTKNVDALRLSAFFHKPQDRPIIAGPIWDFDRSMDSYDSRDNDTNTWIGTGDATSYFNYDWWGVLCQDPDFRQAFYDRWARWRAGPFSRAGLVDIIESLGNEVNQFGSGGLTAAQRDAARWPASNQNAPRSGGYPAEISHLVSWVTQRATWMDRRTLAAGLLPIAPSASFSAVPFSPGDSFSLTGGTGTIYYRLDGGDPRAPGGGIAGTAYTSPIVVNTPVRVIARTRGPAGDWSTPLEMELLSTPPGPQFLPGGTADWNQASHWSSNPAPFPNAPAAAAIILPPGGQADRNVDLRSPVTVGKLTFPQLDSPYRNRLRGQAAGNSLTFDSGSSSPALLEIGGTGTGFVEFEIIGGVVLASDLILDVSNLAGNAEFGPLRLRQGFQGPGGLIKRGPGMTSLTGEAKSYQGPTRIERGVLSFTSPAVPSLSSSVEVLPGGQLRLVSAGTTASPRIHTFGGPLTLRGSGRGEDVPEETGMGRLGALRYDPGSQDNHAIVTNPVLLPESADLHVDGSRNLLELSGPLLSDAASGESRLSKTGGGTLALTADSPGLTMPVEIANGSLRLRAHTPAPIHATAPTTLDAAGSAGPIHGEGHLLVSNRILATPSLDGLRRSLLFTRSGPPDPLQPENPGNSLILTDSPGQAVTLDLHITAPTPPGTIFQGAYLLPAKASWLPVFSQPIRVFTPDAAGSHSHLNLSWSENTSARVTHRPTQLAGPDGPIAGRILEIRFDTSPVAFNHWIEQAFPNPADRENPDLAGPLADPSNSGTANLLRYAFGIQNSANPAPHQPRLTLANPENPAATFEFPYNPALRDLHWRVECSHDLADWKNPEVLFDSSSSLALPDEDGWLRVQDPHPPEGIRFYRLALRLLEP